MTALLNTIQEILRSQSLGLELRSVKLPEKLALGDAYISIKKTLGEGKPIDPHTPKESQFWISKAQQTSVENTWDALSYNELKNIGKCLCDGENPLVSRKDFLRDFLQACDVQMRKSLCRILIWLYLYGFAKDSPGILQLGQWLAKTVIQWDWRWADKQKELQLFGDDSAPSRIAAAILEGNINVSKQIDAYVEYQGLRSGGMIYNAFAKAIEKFNSSAKNESSDKVLICLDRILQWSRLDENSFVYHKVKTEFIEGLLLPWDSVTPDDSIKTRIQGYLVEMFGDPRLGGASWYRVRESAQRIIRRWLVERSLEQFLDVVDQLAPDHQWKYRRAFWMAYHRKNAISDAWVAFASKGATKAKQIARHNKDNSWLSFADLCESGNPNHAVLILCIGSLTVADFSHDGKCRLWHSGNRYAPKPYEKNYAARSGLMHGGAESGYVHSGNWQDRVAKKIYDETGIRLSQKEYMP